MNSLFEKTVSYARETAMLASIQALVEWDERTMMPKGGGEYRAEQVAYLAGKIHERTTAQEFGEWLGELSDESQFTDSHASDQTLLDQKSTIQHLKRGYDKQSKVPQSLVEEMTRLTVRGQQVWDQARQENDFAKFSAVLKPMLKLKIEYAEAIGYEDCPYDVWLDDFEPFETTKNVTRLLSGLRDELVPLIDRIQGSSHQPDASILTRQFPKAAQIEFSRHAASAIGYQFEQGRIDESTHPFCTGIAPGDCRITTRYDERFFSSAFFGTLHEAGHGIYDQGLRADQFGLAPGTFCSLGIHESQSRMWENLVGRSRGFWKHFYPNAQIQFPSALAGVSEEEFYNAVNSVSPSLIRVEADEATYNLHIIIRFEIEQMMVNGEVSVDDLPELWNSKYQSYLGVSPESDANGVLQDVHWSAGLFGYFSTYSLGNLYASQFFEAAEKSLGDLDLAFESGNFNELKSWLNSNIHHYGSCFTANELVEKISCKELSHKPLMRHLTTKYEQVYQL